jgi:hypothetical protein
VSCYYDWTSADGERLGTCASVLGRCEAQFTAILAMCKKDGCTKDRIAFAAKNLHDRTRIRGGLLAYRSIGMKAR